MNTNSILSLNNDVLLSFSKPYHQFSKQESFLNQNLYNKFLNWVSGEFDLYLQEKSNNLEVFFPNGKLLVKKTNQYSDASVAEIYIKTKVLHEGIEIINKVTSIYSALIKINSMAVEV